MKSHIVLVSLGLSIFYLSGCTPAGKSYWLTYKADPKVAPASTYAGYYDIGSDDLIAACLGLDETSPTMPPAPQGENAGQAQKRTKDYEDQVAAYRKRQEEYISRTKNRTKCNKPNEAKPTVTDHDQAKIVLYTTTPSISLSGLDCQITPTKITRKAHPLDIDEKAALADPNIQKPLAYYCDLHAKDAGGMRLDYVIRPHSESEAKKAGATDLVNDSVEVHTLYRFRIMAGPVYSTLSDKDREYQVGSSATGESFVASNVTGTPINAAIFLKYYLYPRDVYETSVLWDQVRCPDDKPDCWKDEWKKKAFELATRINPIVGVNVSSDPLRNVYVGGSFDVLPGLDIVGGLHWSVIDTISGGFTPGQVIPNTITTIPTETKLLQGWFVGIAVDLGIAGSWLGKSTLGVIK
ncbi:MAG: hypothetical protein E8D40_13305 [Nitrospira sp.]|nr:MAG: hypothetical protein E8D40_13305 [Nitrospira sp.]